MRDDMTLPIPRTFRNGVDRRTFLKVVAQATAAIGLSGSHGRQSDGRRGKGSPSFSHLAALPGMHRLHGIAAAHFASRASPK